MRIANLAGRSTLLGSTLALDIERASDGAFPADPQSVWGSWRQLVAWAASVDVDRHADAQAYYAEELLTPVPSPAQIFAVGLNYADHAAEAELPLPTNPVVFTKFASSLTGAEVEVRLPSATVDWEAELVVVIGESARDVAEADAWDVVAGFAVGQDLSDREVQSWGSPAQFSLGKSFRGFSPVGPAVVTLDELRAAGHDPASLRIGCTVIEDGVERTLQSGSTGDMVFPIPALIARLSAIVELRAGDIIFTGTPAGVGMGRRPQEFLHAGSTLVTEIEGVGVIRQKLVA